MFKSGFYEKEITPPLGCCMPGYFRQRLADGVKRPLYAKALAMECEGTCVILIAVDAIFVPKKIYDAAVERIGKYIGIPKEYIMINATHIHTGGPVSDVYDPPYYEPDITYPDTLARGIADCGILAYQRMAPSKTLYSKGEIYGTSFIRNFVMKDGSIRTNPGREHPDIVRPFGDIDPELPVMFFADESGKPKGALINFALHHDCVSGTLYSSDYSGTMADVLKETFGKDFITVFLNGPCGNINHVNVDEPAGERDVSFLIGNRLADEVKKLYKIAKNFEIDNIDSRMEIIQIPRHKIPKEELEEMKQLVETISMDGVGVDMSVPESTMYKRAKAERVLRFAQLPELLDIPVQAIKIGNAMIFAAPGELFVEYGKYMKSNSPVDVNFVGELANGGPSCYIPTPKAFTPSVYESQVPTSQLVPEAGEMIAKCAVKLANELL